MHAIGPSPDAATVREPVRDSHATRTLAAMLARDPVGHAGGVALDQVFGLVYGELKRLAHRALARAGRGTLCTTGLVHEAYLRLAAHPGVSLRGRRHFFALCARAMRQIVIDHARRRHCEKRGASLAPLPLSDQSAFDPARPDNLVALDAALTALEARSPRLVELLQLRLFAGLELIEIAPLFGVTVRQLQRDWQRARLWLFQALLPERAGS